MNNVTVKEKFKLSDVLIEQNKQAFLTLISSISIPGADIGGLIEYLETSDFFTAPASTQYHSSYKGGLCQHSLNVYRDLVKLAEMYTPGKYSDDSLKVVGLLHDLAKVNFYESYIANKKIYNDKGTKHDNMGNFDWFAEESFKVKDADQRLVGAEHGTLSFLNISRFIPMTYEESVAVINHHFINDEGQVMKDISSIYNKYSLATLVHLADMGSTYLHENV